MCGASKRRRKIGRFKHAGVPFVPLCRVAMIDAKERRGNCLLDCVEEQLTLGRCNNQLSGDVRPAHCG